MNAIRVLLADNHAMVRAGLRALLEAAEDMQVIGEAENGHQAVRETERLQPQVVVLDLAMPLLNGIAAARQIGSTMPTIRVLILSSYSDAHHLRQAVAAGVAGYLVKESAANDLLEAIRETSNGGAFLSPNLLHCLSQAKRAAPQNDCGAATTPATLTRREAEVLQLLAEGYANKQTADVLSLSTVEGGCGQVPAPFAKASPVAAHQHAYGLWRPLVLNGPKLGSVLLAHRLAGSPCGRIPGAGVYHLPRLRAWLLFPLPPGQ